MSQQQLFEVAEFLVKLLELDIQERVDPTDPGILIKTIGVLFPELGNVETEMTGMEMEEQWNVVIEVIENHILNGQEIPIQTLGIEQITELYELVAEYAQQWSQHQQKQPNIQQIKQQQKNQSKTKHTVGLTKKQNKNGETKPKSNQEKEKSSKKQSTPSQKHVNPFTDPNSANKQTKQKQNNFEIKQSSKVQKVAPSIVKQLKGETKKEPQPLQNELLKQIKSVMQKKPSNKIKTNVLMRDTKNTEAVAKAKRQFDYYLKQFKRQGKVKYDQKLKQRQTAKQSGLVDEYYLKVLAKKQRNIEQTVMNEQLKYFIALRDKKVAFINKIHKLTEQLQRERQIEWAKKQREAMQQQKAKVQQTIQQTQTLFTANMQMLKQNYQHNKQKNQLQNYNQRKICQQMQQCIKNKKLNQLEEMKVLWEQQNMKLNNIMGDEQKIKGKLIQIYRQHCP